ncbi:hypothetical protein [Nonomuraea aurantiaca]|uniref:hypothetical protein n=1 Tax=Nonomuraea aurantiaca TaxID=2878562 RepID=UPI001CD94B20|nr:hypothetical protein [Nonomuraea aurantiaca]MCA2230223.1 hypothetical protein [Nonomuraea aurantiaca]
MPRVELAGAADGTLVRRNYRQRRKGHAAAFHVTLELRYEDGLLRACLTDG